MVSDTEIVVSDTEIVVSDTKIVVTYMCVLEIVIPVQLHVCIQLLI